MPTIEERVAVLEANHHATTVDVAAVTTAVERLSEQLTSEVRALSEKLSARPSWVVTWIITVLSSGFFGILVAYLNAAR